MPRFLIPALCRPAAFLVFVALSLSLRAFAGDAPPQTGPETERRFPPLQVPPGFKATLFACDPLVEYPSVLTVGPRPGALFVAADFMTGLGYDISRRDEIRRIEDTDGDGYADRAVVVAEGFHSIQGMAYGNENGNETLWVMHAPLLTALRDPDRDGRFEERRDLLRGLGLPPEENPTRLHCANGVVAGRDGWLYLALGDHGCDVPRPEGDRLVLRGGGILRCRGDGRDLHVFATGLRNIYDIALDQDMNVFVRDNENDGGDYMVRVAHSFFGADHGYPYLYSERPAEALRPLADLGRGSSAGGVCYLDLVFPPEYFGNLFFCEWGRAVMRYRPERAGSSFAPLRQIEFATGAPNDPYGFKPTDLVVDRDGTLVVSDWGDGQRPKRGRGRIYRIGPTGGVPQAPRMEERGHRAATTPTSGPDAPAGAPRADDAAEITWLLERAASDPDPSGQVQAIRALADRADPILREHRLDAGPGDAALAARLAAMAPGKDPRVVLEIVIAVGRLGWAEAPRWLSGLLTDPEADPALDHAAMQTLRRARNGKAVLALLDQPDSKPIRTTALRALADRYEGEVIDGLIGRLRVEPDPQRRRQYADLLTRVARKPGPWTYWGYRPPPRPANSVAWERTDAVEQALDGVLGDSDRSIRLDVLRRMLRDRVGTRVSTLAAWLGSERDPAAVSVLLAALSAHPPASVRPLLEAVVRNRAAAVENRQGALALWVGGLDDAFRDQLLAAAGALEDGPVLAALLRQIGTQRVRDAGPFLVGKLKADNPEIRLASVEALTALNAPEAAVSLRALLTDPNPAVRGAAAAAMGQLLIPAAADDLLERARDADPGVRNASLGALRLLREPRTVPLAVRALGVRETQRSALQCLEDLGGPEHLPDVVAVARGGPPTDVLLQVVQLLSAWSEAAGRSPARQQEIQRALAVVQGTGGVVAAWKVAGPLRNDAIPSLIDKLAAPGVPMESAAPVTQGWRTEAATGPDARLRLHPEREPAPDSSWVACADVDMSEASPVQFLSACTGSSRIWLNGRLVYERTASRPFVSDSDRFDATLGRGTNRLVAVFTPVAEVSSFHLRFRRKGSTAEHEQLMRQALTRSGDPERGRAVFLDSERSLCLKCHRFRDQGARIGPDLTAVGGRFPKAYLIESVLEPSRTIAPSFETLAVALRDGRSLVGVRTAETETTLTLGDPEGKAIVCAKADIEAQRPQAVSLMPDGLEKRLSAEEFIHLIAFLASQK